MIIYDVELTTLSPLHIGDGDVLRKGFDFAVRDGRSYRLNLDNLLEAKAELWQRQSSGRSYPVPATLLDEADYKNPSLFRYILKGTPRSGMTYAEVRSFIKDVYDRPYVPGSSLKGAIRTALAWTGWPEVKPHLDISRLNRKAQRAGQLLEQKLFGKDPNNDLLRVLRVSDLSGREQAGAGLILVNAQVFTRRKTGSPVELEAIAGDSAFSGTISIDDYLLTGQPAKKLNFENRSHWIEEVAARVQQHSQARIEQLSAWFEDSEGSQKIASFYRSLMKAKMTEYQALIQIGWGGGWDGKTFWSHLQKDPEQFAEIVYKYRMNRSRSHGPIKEFPSSRRVAVSAGGPAAPFGWCLLTMTKR